MDKGWRYFFDLIDDLHFELVWLSQIKSKIHRIGFLFMASQPNHNKKTVLFIGVPLGRATVAVFES